jgi:hypothetical protein
VSDSGVPTPAALRPPAPVVASDPSRFGRVEADGTVILLAPEGEVVVGQWAAGTPEEGLAFFGRKYDDLVVEVDLISARVSDGRASAEQADAVLTKVREALAARSFVGDVAGLEGRCDELSVAIEQEREAAKARKAEQREAAMTTRRGLADEAESLRDSSSWKATTARYAEIVEEWKSLPRFDRSGEQELWQRISAARSAFDKRRRQHFSELDSQRKDAVARKRDLIAKTEALSASTDWARTSKQLRDLMGDWKAAPRASRADEDRLWKRFKAAQDAFYDARSAADKAADEELRGNVPAKEALVVEAEALLPLGDLKAAKSSLRSVQERWDKAGDLPRGDRERLESRLKKVEEAIRSAEADAWSSSNTTVATDAFTEALARLEAKRDAALARGDAAAAKSLEEQIASTKALMGS